MANKAKFKKFLKKVAKPLAIAAAVIYPPLIPMIGSALVPAGTSALLTAAAGAAALSGGASALAGDSAKDILKNAAIGGITAGTISAVSPTAFDSGLFSSAPTGNASALTNAGMSGQSAQVASAAANKVATEAALNTAVAAGGGLVPSTAGFMSPSLISAAGGAADLATAAISAAPAAVSAATQVASDVASKGLFGDVLKKASEITGIGEDTLGKLGSAAVQTLLSSAGAKKIADQQREAAQTQADATIEAARIAAEANKFRPVGVTTRFGSSNFGYDAQGNLTTAGYTPSAEITGYQDRLRTLAGQGMTDIEGARAAYQPLTGAAQSLFSLGQGYLAKSPEQAAADYISKQQALISPSRQTQLAEVQNRLFQQGRTGAATAQGGNLMNTNPELAAYYNSLAQQDLVLAAQADEEARRRIEFGSGLFDTGANLQGRYYTGQTAAYAPFATAMDTSAALESLAERPLTLGTSIGERTTAGTAAGGRFLSEGITNAAATMAPANAYSASGNLLSGFAQNPMVSSALNNAFGVQPQQRTYTAEDIIRIFGT
jgi:hypothetical protein